MLDDLTSRLILAMPTLLIMVAISSGLTVAWQPSVRVRMVALARFARYSLVSIRGFFSVKLSIT